MFDIGWSELLVIGVVALIVVGPKDLPGMFRTMGKFTGKMRRMARDFQRAMDEAADESGMKETASDLKTMTSPKNLGLDKLKEAADRFDKWEPTKPAPKMAPKPAPAAAPASPAPSGSDYVEQLRKAREESKAKTAAQASQRAADRSAAPPPEPAEAARHTPAARRAALKKNMPKKPAGRGRT